MLSVLSKICVRFTTIDQAKALQIFRENGRFILFYQNLRINLSQKIPGQIFSKRQDYIVLKTDQKKKG